MVKAVFHGVRFRCLFSILAFPAILAILAIRRFPPLAPFLSDSTEVALLRASAMRIPPSRCLTREIRPLYNQDCCRRVVAQLLFCPIPFTVLAV
jgi:hypothetical protein